MAVEGRREHDPKRLAERRELNNGFGDALATAFELAFTSAIFAFIGWRLDEWLGTGPGFLLFLFLFTVSYESWKLFKRYDADMRDARDRAARPAMKVLTAAVPEAPPVERELAFDMVRRGLWVAPVLVLLGAVIWGGDGAWSAAVAVGLVLVNLALSAIALSWAARVSLTMIMVVALAGFAVRMGLVTLVVFLVRDAPWVDLTALAIGILVTHLGLLFWELRYVSASLAYPGLKPGAGKEVSAS